ncbi:unnamed protein product [Zymoseptoria tritici ST99CH_3D7]|uniref:DUF6590 domain-containing protein n=1 Tax=Zymoseptoria tritici (strain ST99CH_3D7) TaxID=1276538 RepID=A0A1X7S4B9_ZYMT9|nr:unnamed protein product [Zymoseptoria tritici ST99CH_3D7]
MVFNTRDRMERPNQGQKRRRDDEQDYRHDDYHTSYAGSMPKKLCSETRTGMRPPRSDGRSMLPPPSRAPRSFDTQGSKQPLPARRFPDTLLIPPTNNQNDPSVAPAKPPTGAMLPQKPLLPVSRCYTGLQPNGVRRFNRDDAYPCLIVTVPWHVTALDPNADPSKDANFVQARPAKISSKRRMCVVIRAGRKSFFALPVTSHGDRGMGHLSAAARAEQIPLRESGDQLECHASNQDFIEVTTNGKGGVGRNSSVDLDGGAHVPYESHIRSVGDVTRRGTAYLMKKYDKLIEQDNIETLKRDPVLAEYLEVKNPGDAERR